MENKKLALRIAAVARAKKAQDILILDMRAVCNFCDYFVILSGTSLRQINAFAEAIQEDLAKDNIESLSKVLPHDESGWVVLDYSGIMVHLFYEPIREFYSLERLWSDAKKVRLPKRS